MSGSIIIKTRHFSKFFDPGWFKSIFCSSGWVRHLWFAFSKLPLKMSIFLIFSPLDQKNLFRSGQKSPRVKGGLASHLLRVKSILGLCWVRAHLYFKIKSWSMKFNFKYLNYFETPCFWQHVGKCLMPAFYECIIVCDIFFYVNHTNIWVFSLNLNFTSLK